MILEARELRKHFRVKGGGTVHAVDDVSFSVEKGETLGIVGESGCGKSTTARLLMHLIEPDAGAVLLEGRRIGSAQGAMPLREARSRMQMVFQDSFASLNPRLTNEASIAFGPMVHGVPASRAIERARSLLDRVGLEPARFGGRYPHELSGGQRQRVNIARALALEPRIVILDEAVSALDKSVEAQVLNLLLELKSELGLTYIFISHDLSVVRYMSDRVMVMYLGKIAEIGPVDSIYGRTAHPYTKALLSAMPSMDPSKRTEAPPLAGDPPSPIDPAPGCRFRTRCGYAEGACEHTDPPLGAAGEMHHVACLMRLPGSGHSKAAAHAG
ncbi:MAG: ABC transporter ATP-binding protein [Betaproteobacteria bacterium]|nr:ABC transporter ATP-binding protein [Betaproteobacteria bacterium]